MANALQVVYHFIWQTIVLLSTDQQPGAQNLPIPEAVYAPSTAVPSNKEIEPEL